VKDSDDVRTLDAFRRQYGVANQLYDRLAEDRIERLRRDAEGKERERLAALARQQEEERQRAQAKRQADEAAKRDPVLSVRPGSGESFRDGRADGQPCPECPEMVVVPAGSFTMRPPKGEKPAVNDKSQQREVRFVQPFAAGRYEVTFGEWDACVSAGGCAGNKSPSDEGWGRGKRPVINVSWNDANEYVAWLSHTTGKTYRLLTEAEWEYAARAGTTTPFWWGSSISTNQANYNGNYFGEHRGKTLPVDSFAANPWGLYNVHGNVEELVQDCRGARADPTAITTGDCNKVRRGGSWTDGAWSVQSASRSTYFPADRSDHIGFRVKRTLSAGAGAPGAH
jgi:formylglycine-generating enzyme required for sulfatase activity